MVLQFPGPWLPHGSLRLKNCIIRAINKLGEDLLKKLNKKEGAGQLHALNVLHMLHVIQMGNKIVAQVAVPLADTETSAHNILETMLVPTKLAKINNSMAHVQLIFR